MRFLTIGSALVGLIASSASQENKATNFVNVDASVAAYNSSDASDITSVDPKSKSKLEFQWGCWGVDHFLKEEMVELQGKAQGWFDMGHKMDTREGVIFTYKTAAYVVCNCKYTWKDGADPWEMQLTDALLDAHCGGARGDGWVYSPNYDKSYLRTASEEIWKRDRPIELCPAKCVNAVRFVITE